MEITHSMTYTSGGGTEYDGGLWNIKETPKTLTFTIVEKPFYESAHTGDVMRIKKEKEKRHVLRDWDYEDEYVVYPNCAGIPHFFQPIVRPVQKTPQSLNGCKSEAQLGKVTTDKSDTHENYDQRR